MDEDRDDRPDVPGHRLLHVIGSGASSVVWAGTDAAGRPVAVKVPRNQPDEVAVREVAIERHVLMAVEHEHLVPLRDVVPLPGGRVALVFELVVGATLASLVASRGQLRPGEVVTVLTPIAEAVAAIHAAGAVHCDISPGNVMLTAAGRPLLMDLGAARLAGTGAGAVVGTPGFVAPEIRAGDRPSEASDVFSLGALAWFCLTGNGAPDTLLRLSDETVRSHVGAELAPVVGRCIDPEPEVRPSSAALPAMVFDAVRREPVEVVVGADEASALTHRIRAEAAAGPSPEAQPPRPWFRRVHVEPPRWSHRLTAIAGIAALAVVLGWLAHVGLLPGTGPTRGPTSAASISDPGDASAPTGVAAREDPAAASDPAAQSLIQKLTDLRVKALVEREPSALATVHRAQSPSWRMDMAIVEDLRSARKRYAGLHMTVVEAHFRSSSDAVAVVRARVAVAAYTVVDDRGRSVSKSAQAGQPLDFHLVHAGDGWRIESISEPRPS